MKFTEDKLEQAIIELLGAECLWGLIFPGCLRTFSDYCNYRN